MEGSADRRLLHRCGQLIEVRSEHHILDARTAAHGGCIVCLHCILVDAHIRSHVEFVPLNDVAERSSRRARGDTTGTQSTGSAHQQLGGGGQASVENDRMTSCTAEHQPQQQPTAANTVSACTLVLLCAPILICVPCACCAVCAHRDRTGQRTADVWRRARWAVAPSAEFASSLQWNHHSEQSQRAR